MIRLIEKAILKYTEYESGYTPEDGEKVLTASMIGGEPLQNFLTVKHGKDISRSNEKINDSTVGTLCHSGLEKIWGSLDKLPEGVKVYTERNMHMKLPNNWVLSGTADVIIRDSVKKTVLIGDYKVVKIYRFLDPKSKNIKKDFSDDQYATQLNVLSLLFMNDEANKDFKPPRKYILPLFKDANALKGEFTWNPIEIPKLKKREVINENLEVVKADGDEALLIEIKAEMARIDKHLENGTMPDKCDNLWWGYHNKKKIPKRCVFYCDHGKEGRCPHYTKDMKITELTTF